MKSRNRLFILLVCVLVAVVVLAACDPEEDLQPKKLDHIEVNTANAQTEFAVGDAFTYQGLAVTAFYDDDTSAIVTGYSVTANGLDEDGKLTAESNMATVSYTEEDVTKTATYNIAVTAGAVGPGIDDPGKDDPSKDDPSKDDPEASIVGIKITKEPNTTTYYVGEKFTTDGLEIEATYDDNTTKTVTTGFSASAATAMAGEITVTVTYEGKTDTFTITVYDKLTGLAVDGKRAYNLGDDFEGITVTALYNGKTTGGVALEADDFDFEIEPALNDGKFDTIGKYTITVAYSEEKIEGRPNNASEKFEITVVDPDDPDAIVWGEEGKSVGEWKYWSDENIVDVTEVKFIDKEDGINIHAAFSSTGALDYGFQLFYNDLTNYTLNSTYTLTFTVTSTSNCEVVINGKNYNLTANNPTEVEVKFTYSYNGEYTGMSLFDMQVIVVAGKSYDLTLTNIAWEENSDNSGGGDVGGDKTGETVIYDVFFDPNIIGFWFRTANYTLEDFDSAEMLVNGAHFADAYQVQTGGDGEFRPMFDNIFSLTGSAEGSKYTIQIKLDGVVYDPVNKVAGGPHTANGYTYTLAVENGKLVLTVKSESSTVDPDPDPGTGGGETDPVEPGDVRNVTITNTDFYSPGFVKLYMAQGDLEFIRDNASYIEVNGARGTWNGNGYLVDGTVCIQVNITDGASKYEFKWYDAAGNLIAQAVYEKGKPDPGTGGGTTPPVIPGDGYVVQLTKIEDYSNMYVKLYMSSEDFDLLKGAAKVVVNGTYTGDNWAGGFLVDGTICIHVRLVFDGKASGDYVLTWYDADGNLIATCAFTI